MPTFVEWLHQLAPTWLQGPGGTAMTTVIGSELDRATDLVRQAVQARFPEFAPLDGLKKLGEERGIPKADWETDGDYAAYLVRAWDAWEGTDVAGGGAGTPASILIALHRLLGGGFSLAQDLAGDPEAAALVQWNGRYVQLYKDFRTPIFGFLDGCQSRAYTPASSFVPTDLGSTLKLWLRGDIGITQSGGNVTAWADQSGNANNVTNVGTVPFAASSINGLPGITCAANAGMQNTTSSPISAGGPRTVIVVAKASSEYGGALFCNYRTANTQEVHLWGAASPEPGMVYASNLGAGGRNQDISPTPTISGSLILEVTYAGPSGALATAAINGAPQSVGVPYGAAILVETGSAGFGVGILPYNTTAFGWHGDICEVIVCDSILSAANMAKLHDYLYLRYQLGVRSSVIYPPGWYDGTSYWSRSWLILPTPGGVITKVNDDGTILTLGNDAGNVLKARLNAEVMRWKGAREAYGGAYVTDSYNPRRDSGAPPGSDFWWVAQSAPVSYMVGWPPSSLDSNHVLGDGFVLDGISSLHIDPP